MGDCGNYHGWVVGVSLADPHQVISWSTRARGGGIWAPGGISVAAGSLFAATGNTFGASTWSDGEAVFRLAADLHRSTEKRDYSMCRPEAARRRWSSRSGRTARHIYLTATISAGSVVRSCPRPFHRRPFAPPQRAIRSAVRASLRFKGRERAVRCPDATADLRFLRSQQDLLPPWRQLGVEACAARDLQS